MTLAVCFVRFGNKLLNAFVAVLVLAMLAFGGYELWYDWSIAQGAFLDDDIMQYKPVASEDGSNPTLEELMLINEDVIGWITVDDTNIDYPLVQGATDMEYVNKDVYGDFSFSGAIFLSCTNSPDLTDIYNLIYGHHMDNGGMFGDLEEFVDADFFEEHTTGTIYMIDRTIQLEIFACLETDAYDSYVFNTTTSDDNAARIAYIEENATNFRDIGVETGDQIVALSTCKDAVTSGRIILFARMVE